MQTTGYTQEQAGQIKFYHKTFKRVCPVVGKKNWNETKMNLY